MDPELIYILYQQYGFKSYYQSRETNFQKMQEIKPYNPSHKKQLWPVLWPIKKIKPFMNFDLP